MVLQPEFSPHPVEVILADSCIIMFGAPVLEQLQPLQHLLAATLTAHDLAGDFPPNAGTGASKVWR